MTQSKHLPPLEPIGNFRSYVCGDVMIDETAAIAAGVLIQADQGSRIIIAAGVCIGMGTVIHAQNGVLEIGAGANLGAGVLVYGNSKIGEGACIGASSSIVRAVISKGQIVPPCSLINGLEDVEKLVQEEEKTEIKLPIDLLSDLSSDFALPLDHNLLDNPDSNGAIVDSANPESSESTATDIDALIMASSVQAKAHAKQQISRYIKSIFPQT
jgi:carbonic anhydrase/acetyltransferase-like protein (isoleucine patch superfamily)